MSSLTTTAQEQLGSIASAAQRRSMRVLFSTPIYVSGRDSRNRDFLEHTRTLVVNAHGALISLAAMVTTGQQIMVRTEGTKQFRKCRVVYSGRWTSGRTLIGIELVKPSSTFWQIDFPPDDWEFQED
jgi:hypothetical protein